MKQKNRLRVWLRRALCVLMVATMLPLGALTVFADGEYSREMSVSDITVTANGKTIGGIYSDPVSY